MIDWRKAVVEWCRTTKRINIFDDPHREPTLPSKMGGAYYAAIRERDYGDETVALDMMMQFHSITVRDGVPIDVAHREFMKVGQYRDRISPDSPGM